MKWVWRSFEELSNAELYAVMRLRQEVFVVEQECAYLDADGLDAQCDHLLGLDDEGLAAYVRAVPPGVSYPEYPAIGRVITAPRCRGTGLGRPLMNEAIRGVNERWPGPIKIGAQAHLSRYYGSLGFEVCGPEYDEDGIPHLPMLWA
ncbi:MAG: GNAT family N-acetyltransferase [Proteobacteria bacterium]|nr:GNAT family N-acetyltransferase [Pseudomonadota bacterium]MCP4918471.1 GNAT family N-acetyltransferase [Pseudomonadota bacterium]